ncbi:MAG TPA: ATP-binding cassette domain-containing protein [Rhodanobacteraceae bacterium]|nr:ATP-binding cassette domain-containing protein [Rhodanobacteraceae bacterium]
MTAHIKVEHAALKVPIYLQPDRQARSWLSVFAGAVLDPPRRRYVTLLNDLCFEVNAGDRLAILGRNGAGKSTLLRLLNGVYAPTSGKVEVRGSRSAMLNISLGFNGEATVRENIFLRGAAMGIPSSHLREQLLPILEFAGLVEKANHRLHTLSTGQKMRLGFATSTCVQSDVILMDEWIGAGDANFTQRAGERMKSQMGEGTIMVLASHSDGLLRGLCNKAIVLEQGRLIHSGDIEPSLKFYHQHLARLREQASIDAEAAGLPEGQSIYGCVENIVLEVGVLQLKGWLARTDGPTPRHIAVQVDGARFPSRRIERYNRPDVVQHLGLVEDGCGFRASFAIPKLKSLHELRGTLRVYGGTSSGDTNVSLRLGPAVLAAIERG